MSKFRKIAIIGGGFSGVMLANHLMQGTHGQGLHLSVYEKNQFAAGPAYSTPFDCHLLNVRASSMSAFSEDARQTDFMEWCAQSGWIGDNDIDLSDSFMPRKIYQKYLNNILNETLKAFPANIRLVRQDIQKCSADSSGWCLHDAAGNVEHFDICVLALGSLPSQSWQRYCDSAKTIENVIQPWQWRSLASIQPSDSVFILGSGLTMVDVLLVLQQQQHVGSVDILSRRGLSPKSHLFDVPPQLSPAVMSGSLRKVFRLLKNATRKASAWQLCIDAMRSQTQSIWQQWTLREQRQFLRHVSPWWEVHRHRVAPDIGQFLQGFFQTHRVTRHAGRLDQVIHSRQGFDIQWHSRGQAQLQRVEATHFINCTGAGGILQQPAGTLIHDLMTQGVIRADVIQGVAANAAGQVLSQNGIYQENLYVCGSLSRGRYYEMTAVPELRRQCAEMAEHLIQKCH